MGLHFLYVSLLIPFLFSTSEAASWQPKAGLEQIKVWPGQAPGVTEKLVKEETLQTGTKLVGGKPYEYIENVSTPTMTIYSPKKSSGVSVVVFPGGGHKILAIDIEGTEVCEWLIQSNITCVLLKYRVPNSGCYWDKETNSNITPSIPMALQDAQRTISTLRYHAKKYNLDPHKIGVMGFSAGGNVAVLSSTAFNKRSYEPIDDIDKVSSRPDFAIPVFPGHMTMEHKNKTPKKIAAQELNSDIVISKEIPPTLLVHAEDDPVDPVRYSKLYAKELKKAGVKVKLNTYKTGGHAFGVRKQNKASDRWPDDALIWLKEIGML